MKNELMQKIMNIIYNNNNNIQEVGDTVLNLKVHVAL